MPLDRHVTFTPKDGCVRQESANRRYDDGDEVPQLSVEEQEKWSDFKEKEAVQEENRLRRCCPSVEDKIPRARFTTFKGSM